MVNEMTTYVYDFGKSRYVNLSSRCSMKCHFCPKTKGDKRMGVYNLEHQKRQPLNAQFFIDKLGDVSEVDEVVFCGYSEPTERLALLIQIAAWCKHQGATTRLNTNGHGQFYNRRPIEFQLKHVIDKVSVSLNAQNEQLYNHHCRPRFRGAYQMMLRFCSECIKHGMHVEMSVVDGLAGIDMMECEKITTDIGAVFKRRELDFLLSKEK